MVHKGAGIYTLRQKELLMRCFVLIILMLAAVSCDRLWHPGGGGRRDGMDAHSGHIFHRDPDESSSRDSVLLTGIEYAVGYDWVRDTAHSSVSANLILFRGGTRLLRIPCGGSALWPAEPDCHRICGGHVYSFAVREGYTIVGEDGEETLRYPSEESIRGFAIEDGHILTLGQRLGGSGFSFRRDGRVMFKSDGGTVCGSLDQGIPASGALYCDNGHWYFTYREDGSIHLVEDNLERALPGMPLLDAKVHNGLLLLVYARKQAFGTYLYMSAGGYEMQLPPALHENVRSASFVCLGNQVRLVADVAGARYVWDAGSSRLMAVYRGEECELYPLPGMDAAVVTSGGRVVRIDPYGIPRWDCALVSGACAAVKGNTFMVALSGIDGSPGVLLRDSIKTLFDLNGPLTSLSIE